ncbi:MAG: DUF1924 domain-containing protein [Sedimenticola sp.]|nr:DUF1924 domain-containing protein [Sedimenticola sp.]
MNPLTLIPLLLVTLSTQASPTSDALLERYSKQGAGPFNADTGRQLWLSKKPLSKDGSLRSCTDCHGSNLKQPGKHIRTGKIIAPMNPAAATDRLTDHAKVEKWFMRNCKWTLGRECTAQEKGDLIMFIQQP